MAQPALTLRPRYTSDDVRIPGMTRVRCTGCGEIVGEVLAGVVRAPSIKRAVIVVRCNRKGCGHFNKINVPEIVESSPT